MRERREDPRDRRGDRDRDRSREKRDKRRSRSRDEKRERARRDSSEDDRKPRKRKRRNPRKKRRGEAMGLPLIVVLIQRMKELDLPQKMEENTRETRGKGMLVEREGRILEIEGEIETEIEAGKKERR